MEAKKNLVVNFYAGAEEIGSPRSGKLNNLWKEEKIIGLKLFYYVIPSNKRVY